MNARIYCLSDKILLGRTSNKSIQYVSKCLFSKGFRIDEIQILPNNVTENFDDITRFEGKQNLFVYILDSQISYPQILNGICQKTGVEKATSNIAKTVIQSRYSSKNIPMPKESADCQLVPEGAYVVGNIYSDIQCVVLSSKNDFYLIMPSGEQELETYLDKMLSFVLQNQPQYKQCQTFKTFGLSEQNIRQVLSDLIKNKDKISINVYSDNLDSEIIIRSKSEQVAFNEYVGKVFSRLNKYIYAEEAISMEQTLFRLLSNSNLNVSFGESITHGNILNSLMTANPEFSKYIKATYVFQDAKNICDRISAKTSTIQNFGNSSVETIFEVSSNIINETGSDIVCGVVGSFENEVCKSYVAVGDKNAIHVYKNTFCAPFCEAIDSTTKATLFYLIKKLRQNDFHFDKKTI